MPAQKSRIIRGFKLQAAALFVTFGSVATLYAIAWLPVLFIAIPLFVASIVVMLRSGARWWLRLLLAFWPVAIPMGYAAVQGAIEALQWQMARTEVFLIPSDYRGSVEIVFDDPAGVPRVRDHGRAIFRIPADGSLHTRDHSGYYYVRDVNKAIDARREFYFVDKLGHRIKIDQREENQPRDRTSVNFMISYDNFQPVNGILEESRYKYYVFFVGTPDEEFKAPFK